MPRYLRRGISCTPNNEPFCACDKSHSSRPAFSLLSDIESAKFADRKDDPPASIYVLEFLGKHADVAAKSVDRRIHNLTGWRAPGKLAPTVCPNQNLYQAMRNHFVERE